MIRLNRTHLFLKLQAKFFNYALSFSKISSELSRIYSICPHTPRMTQKSHHLLTHYIVCFRCLTSGRELPKIPANQVKFAQFAHRSHELRKFCAFCTKIHPHLVHFLQTSEHRQRTLENWSESTRFCTVRPQHP